MEGTAANYTVVLTRVRLPDLQNQKGLGGQLAQPHSASSISLSQSFLPSIGFQTSLEKPCPRGLPQ